MVFQQKPLEKADFTDKITGLAVVRPASSDKWKALLVRITMTILLRIGKTLNKKHYGNLTKNR